MLGRVCNLLSLAVLSAVAITTPAAARLQPSGGQPQLSGSARLTGRVVAADNGRPVRRTYVSLSGLPDSQRNAGPNRISVSRKVETDVNGRFDFAHLPAGWYSINLDAVSGFVRLARPKEATLTEGQTVEMTVRLERSGAIEGRIQDENGDGLFGTQVQAVRRLNVSGHTALGSSGPSAPTNDLGEFRLFNLPAGEYYVVATYMRSQGRDDPAPLSGYANTYYPGSPALRSARAVVVRGGRDSKRVNFTLAPCRLAKLSINPVDSSGAPLGPGAQMTLTKRDDVYLSSSTRHTSQREDGTFLFEGIQPGDYYLVVTTSGLMEEAVYVNVSIDEADVSLNVQTNTGAKVSGRIVVDGRPAADGDSLSPKASISANPPLGTLGVSYARVPVARAQATGRFELAGLRGPMVLSAEIAGGALLSIQRRGEEIAGKTLEFVGTETLDDVVVEFTTQVAQVDVTVTSASARGESEPVLLILFAEDPKRWHEGSIQYTRTAAPPVSDGAGIPPSATTRLTRMAPGRYFIAAIHDIDIHPTDVGVLEKLRPLAVPITLIGGQTAKVTVPVARTSSIDGGGT
jgi:hypothetical protein